MSEWLLSVGLDVGTTTTQLIVSQLQVENRSSGFTVPEMVIADRVLRYCSPVYFTPLQGENLVDGAGIREIVEREYARAGITRKDVDTGAVIITGETSRKENAGRVLAALSDFAGDFVVATAGPELESVLAAKGAGALAYSDKTGETVLHMDIGGGTSNLALIREGKILAATCLNVGGRLLKFGENGLVRYVSPVLSGLTTLQVGEKAPLHQVEQLADTLVQGLEMAAGLRPANSLLEKLMTGEVTAPWTPPGENLTLSFSGGVADCMEQALPWLEFGDMGPVLGKAIRKSLLCRGKYRLGTQTIRATVIGAGCHSTQLSGSTVFYQNVTLPFKNIPVVTISKEEQLLPRSSLAEVIRQRCSMQDSRPVLALPGLKTGGYAAVRELAAAIAEGLGSGDIWVALEEDMAKALGQAIALLAGKDRQVLCIDSVKLTPGSYLDVGAPIGPALPVVVKTLVLSA